MADLTVAAVIAGEDKLSGPASKAAKSLDQLDSAASKAAKGFNPFNQALQTGIGLAAGLRIFDTVSGAISSAAKAMVGFEKTVSGVKAVSGATTGQMQALSGLALQLGKDTAFSASQAAAGIEELVKGGVSLADIMGGAAVASLNLAAAGQVDLASAAEIAANAMSQFGLKGSDMAKVSDLIAGAANASSLGVNDFKFSLAAVGSVAALAGVSFDSTAVAIAQLGSAGIKGSDAGTSLKAMLNTLIPTTDVAKDKMRELGIITADGSNQFIDATGKIKDFGAISEILQTQTAGLTASQRLLALELIFGADGMRAAGVLAKEGGEGFAEMEAAMKKVTAESVAMERLNNLSGDLDQLGGSAETAGIILLSEFSPALREAAKAATGLVNNFAQEAQTIIQTAKNISGEHGIGLIPAAFIAIEGRIKEVFGETWSGAFNTAKGTLDEFGEKLGEAKVWIGEHKEAVGGLAIAYGTLTGLQAAGGAAASISAVGLAARTADPKLLALAAAVGLVAAAAMRFEGVRNVINGFFETWKVGADDHVKKTELIINAIAGLPDAFNKWVHEAGAALLIGSVQLYQGAMKIGKDIVAGVIAGFWAGAPGLATAAWQLGANAIAAIRNAVDAHSPSRAAQEIGEDVGAGFAIGLESVAEGIGATMPTVRDLIQEARDKINDDLLESDRDLQRTLELETIKHGRRMAELELDLGRSKGKERENVQHRMEEETRAHLQRIEDAQRRHDDKLVELEYGAGARIAEATRKQAEQRGKALADFSSAFDDLVRETESKSAEIGRKAGDAVRDAIRDSARAIDDARSRAGESIQSAVEGLGNSRLLRGRRDEFSGRQNEDARKRSDLREDSELERDFLLDMAKARAKYDRDRANAKTAEERGQLSDSYDLERDNLRARFQEAKDDLAHRRQLAAEDRVFREQQEKDRRAFDDQLENEALQRTVARFISERDERIASITQTLAEKQRAVEEQETKERAALKTSFEAKAKDLRESLIEKLGPLTADAAAALGGFLDTIATKVSTTSAQIIGQAAAAAAAIASMGSTQAAQDTISSVAQTIAQLAGSGALSSGTGGSSTVATTGSQAAAALLNAGTAAQAILNGYQPGGGAGGGYHAFADGGMIPETVLGRGLESRDLYSFGAGETVIPRGGGGTTVVIHVHVAGSVQTEQDLVRSIYGGLRELERSGLRLGNSAS